MKSIKISVIILTMASGNRIFTQRFSKCFTSIFPHSSRQPFHPLVTKRRVEGEGQRSWKRQSLAPWQVAGVPGICVWPYLTLSGSLQALPKPRTLLRGFCSWCFYAEPIGMVPAISFIPLISPGREKNDFPISRTHSGSHLILQIPDEGPRRWGSLGFADWWRSLESASQGKALTQVLPAQPSRAPAGIKGISHGQTAWQLLSYYDQVPSFYYLCLEEDMDKSLTCAPIRSFSTQKTRVSRRYLHSPGKHLWIPVHPRSHPKPFCMSVLSTPLLPVCQLISWWIENSNWKQCYTINHWDLYIAYSRYLPVRFLYYVMNSYGCAQALCKAELGQICCVYGLSVSDIVKVLACTDVHLLWKSCFGFIWWPGFGSIWTVGQMLGVHINIWPKAAYDSLLPVSLQHSHTIYQSQCWILLARPICNII